MIYLDTHVVVWLYAGLKEKLSPRAVTAINGNELGISPVVRLELQYLFEIKRIRATASRIFDELSNRIGLGCCTKTLDAVVDQAMKCPWTRDPFDRLIVAHAAIDNSMLVTKDSRILENYDRAVW